MLKTNARDKNPFLIPEAYIIDDLKESQRDTQKEGYAMPSYPNLDGCEKPQTTTTQTVIIIEL